MVFGYLKSFLQWFKNGNNRESRGTQYNMYIYVNIYVYMYYMYKPVYNKIKIKTTKKILPLYFC